MRDRAGSAHPDFPDTYGRGLARILELCGLRVVEFDELFGEPGPEHPSDAEMDVMWEREERERREAYKPHSHRCGHVCESGACYVMAGLNDWQCIACQLKEKDRH